MLLDPTTQGGGSHTDVLPESDCGQLSRAEDFIRIRLGAREPTGHFGHGQQRVIILFDSRGRRAEGEQTFVKRSLDTAAARKERKDRLRREGVGELTVHREGVERGHGSYRGIHRALPRDSCQRSPKESHSGSPIESQCESVTGSRT
jgi:hypothetical protein